MIKIPLMLEEDVKKQCDEAPVAPDPDGWLVSIRQIAEYCGCHELTTKERILRKEIFTIGAAYYVVSNTAWVASPSKAVKIGTVKHAVS